MLDDVQGLEEESVSEVGTNTSTLVEICHHVGTQGNQNKSKQR